MNKIIVCIPTYQRPELLKKLVISILECNIDRSLIKDVSIIIVDNDAGKTAEPAVTGLKENNRKDHEIAYYHLPLKGLSNVRNELLQIGMDRNPDFLVFVDDDEFVSQNWLNELVGTIVKNNGDMTMGPVISHVSKKIPEYVSYWLERSGHTDNEKLYYIRTGNLIIRAESLSEKKIRFDPRFNHTGGEDSYFGLQMLKKGATIYWASRAIVYETVPDERANISWIAMRYYNGANKYSYILRIENNYSKIIKKLVVSFLYIILGFFSLILIPFPIRKRYLGILKLYEGWGGIKGLLGLRYNEY